MEVSKQVEQIYRVRLTLFDLIKSRGFNFENINHTMPLEYISMLYDRFINDEPVYDISIIEDRKLYIKFIPMLKDYNHASIPLRKFYEMLVLSLGLTKQDDIIFIIMDNNLDKLPESILNFEKTKSNLNIFHYKSLLVNILNNEYVPEHKRATNLEISELMDTYKIKDFKQLPLLLKSDPVAKFLGLKRGEICKIIRPSTNGIRHTVFRYVI
jgi:DNA-directed RNA polymerase I, II, and III subunit RPABC1